MALIHPRVSIADQSRGFGDRAPGQASCADLCRAGCGGARRIHGRIRSRRRIGPGDCGKHGVQAFASEIEAAEAADALSIVTPTDSHFELARMLVGAGAARARGKTDDQHGRRGGSADRLAQERNCTLQVGHVERFQPRFAYLEKGAVAIPSLLRRIDCRPIPRGAWTLAWRWI